MKQRILALYNYFEQNPRRLYWLLAGVILLFTLCLSRLQFSENINDFLPQSEKAQKISEAYQHIDTGNKILVTLSCTDTFTGYRDSLIQLAETFQSELKKNDTRNLTSDLFCKISDADIAELTDFILENLPYFMSSEDYKRLDSLMIDESKIRQELQWNQNMLYSPTGSFFQNIILKDPLHISNSILKKLKDSYQENTFQQYNSYIFNKTKDKLLITLSSETPASETNLNKEWIKIIDKTAQNSLKGKENLYQIKHIGACEISISNAQQIKSDTLVSSIIALLGICVLLFFFYKDIRAIGLILFSILFGSLFALGFLALFKESISIIAIGIGSVIVGIAVNYPLHFLAHLKECSDRKETIREIATPLIVGNVTTVGAFLSILFIRSQAMRDMGLFSALLLIGTILFVLLFIPHLFKNKLFKAQQSHQLMFGKIVNVEWEKKKWLVWGIILLTIPFYYFSTKTEFETDLHKINYMTDSQKEELSMLIDETENNHAKMYCVCDGKDLDEALEHLTKLQKETAELKKKGLIIRESGVGCFATTLKSRTDHIQKWNEYWNANKEIMTKLIIKEGEAIGFNYSIFSHFIDKISQPMVIDDEKHFQPIQKALTNLYIYEDSCKALVYTVIECEKEKVFQLEKQLNKIAPNIYTINTQSYFQQMIETLSQDFNHVLFICAFIVFLFLTLSFGRVELSLLAFLPLTFGWIWILGIMNLCDIRFNIVNIILSTFIFGQGDDYTIFVTEGLMYEYTHKKKVLASYKNSVFLSACIMFIGIGALIVAKHPAMKSLAELTIVGMFCVILMAYLFPPLIYKWLTTHKGEARLMPITLRNLGSTAVSFFVFLIGSLVISIIGFFLLTIRKKSDKNKLKYHTILCNTLRRMARLIPNIKHNIINESNHNFDEPSILICNHQSHIDLMYTLMLHPKIICLTNQWVWNCPFYGRIIRYADFFPVSEGIEKSVETLKSVIQKGYSILIFPEGTRSEDCSIQRFHQGAFYLAQKFNLNIVPIVIHGVGHVFPKQEFILRKGRVDVKILPEVNSDNPLRTNIDTKSTAQAFRKYYQEEYKKMCEEIETVDYFKDLVYHNYIYKGASIAKEAHKKIFSSAANEFISKLPDHGEYTINECGQGEYALLAALVKKDLHIIATETDKEKLSIARNCISVPKNLEYK